MDEKYLNLYNKTFLDFQPSQEALDSILVGGETDEAYRRNYLQDDIDYFLEEVETDSERRAYSFVEFMDYTDDEKLKAAIKDQFREAYEHCERYANIAVQ